MNRITIEKAVLSENNRLAAELRQRLDEAGALALNFIGSPGAGKTYLLERTLELLPAHTRAAVLTGDIQTENDAIRLSRYGYPVRQILTNGACHLDANMIATHLGNWIEKGLDLLLLENVGNLVCPTSFDLGEDHKVVVLSVTEGEDKPLKYPATFSKAEVLVLTKTDLLKHLQYDIQAVRDNARQIHPGIEIFEVSCTTAAGLDQWVQWLVNRMKQKKLQGRPLEMHRVAV